MSEADHYSVVILGAGMSGLCMAIQLQRAGIDDFLIVEQQDGIGGTWWANRYPGAQVDVPAPVYAFSFAPNPAWRQRFADAAEIQRYLQQLAEAHGLLPKLRLSTRLLDARWDSEAARWRLRTTAGDALSAQFFVCSTGPLSQPRWPDVAGLDTFAGQRLHSASWDSAISLHDKSVAVIGTGASAVQLIPPLAARCARLHVYQRSPNWILPRPVRRYRWFDRWLMRLPGYARAVRGGWMLLLEGVRRGFVAGTLMRRVLLLQAALLRRWQIKRQAMRAALTPDYPIGCKRMIFSNDYYPALQRGNVELVTRGIARVTATSIIDADGRERPIDALVCATGFDTVNLLASVEIAGRDGQRLREVWAGEPQAFHGIGVPGFPNFFLLLGPNTATGHTSTLLFIEPAVAHVIACIQRVRVAGKRSIEVRAEPFAAHNAALQARLSGSIWSQCRSWYRSASGRVVALFPGYVREYRRGLAALAEDVWLIDA